MKTRTLIPCLLLAFAIAGCQKADDKKEGDKGKPTPVAKAKQGDTATHAAPGATRPGDAEKKDCAGDCEGKDCGEGHEKGEDGHNCSDTSHLSHDKLVERTDEKGRKVMHAGKEFTKAPVVSVAELLSKPDDYAGKTITVEGDISAMCHHKRGWFAVVAPDKSGRQLRIQTAPVFRVPPKSIGKASRAEGTVDWIEIPEAMAKHLAKEHKLDMRDVKDGKVRKPILRATGADFI